MVPYTDTIVCYATVLYSQQLKWLSLLCRNSNTPEWFFTFWEYDASISSSLKILMSGLGKLPLSDRGMYASQQPGTIDKSEGIFLHSDNCFVKHFHFLLCRFLGPFILQAGWCGAEEAWQIALYNFLHFWGVVKSISQIGAYSTFLTLSANHLHEVYKCRKCFS